MGYSAQLFEWVGKLGQELLSYCLRQICSGGRGKRTAQNPDPCFQRGEMKCVGSITNVFQKPDFICSVLYNAGLPKASIALFCIEYNSNQIICICLKSETGMYFISTDKICLSSILFPENFPSLQKWIFHLLISNLPYGPLGVLLVLRTLTPLRGGNCLCVREFKHTLL